jgi:hypothetical protein
MTSLPQRTINVVLSEGGNPDVSLFYSLKAEAVALEMLLDFRFNSRLPLTTYYYHQWKAALVFAERG